LGSTTGLTDSNGVVTESASYDSFGRTISSNLTTRYQYTGREYDEYTGLMFYRARFYDPQIGRFISEDPIEFGGGINWYGYVNNKPVKHNDPRGLDDADRDWEERFQPTVPRNPASDDDYYNNANPEIEIRTCPLGYHLELDTGCFDYVNGVCSFGAYGATAAGVSSLAGPFVGFKYGPRAGLAVGAFGRYRAWVALYTYRLCQKCVPDNPNAPGWINTYAF